MSGKDSSDRYPIRPRDPKHSASQISKIPLMLTLYSFPAIFILAGGSFTGALVRIGVLLFCFGFPLSWLIVGIIIHPAPSTERGVLNMKIWGTKLSTIIGLPQSGKWAPESNPVEPPTRVEYGQNHDLETLRVEYQSLVSEAQYRDKLLLQTTYFALGAIGLFAGILSTATTTRTTPAVAMLASVVMLGFATATNSYKDSRDALWDRIGRLENSVPAFRGYLTTFNTVRAMNLRLLNTISLSSYAVGLTMFMTALAYLVYLWSALFSL